MASLKAERDKAWRHAEVRRFIDAIKVDPLEERPEYVGRKFTTYVAPPATINSSAKTLASLPMDPPGMNPRHLPLWPLVADLALSKFQGKVYAHNIVLYDLLGPPLVRAGIMDEDPEDRRLKGKVLQAVKAGYFADPYFADQVCCALGRHPGEIWKARWWDLPLTARELKGLARVSNLSKGWVPKLPRPIYDSHKIGQAKLFAADDAQRWIDAVEVHRQHRADLTKRNTREMHHRSAMARYRRADVVKQQARYEELTEKMSHLNAQERKDLGYGSRA